MIEWIFEGIGTVVVGGIITLSGRLITKIVRSRSNSITINATSKGGHINMSGNVICNQVSGDNFCNIIGSGNSVLNAGDGKDVFIQRGKAGGKYY